MKRTTLFFVLALAIISFTLLAGDWNLDPHLYSRGGITVKDDFSRKGVNEENFNLGAWSGESNAFAPPLTEITLEVKKGDKFKYTYGVDVGNNMRFFDKNTTPTPLNERLNFVEFIHSAQTSFWFGQRAYRGDGDFLTRSFPFDEHNMLGGGVRMEKIGPVNLEFAYGIKERTEQSRLINILINKAEYPLSNGKIKTNLELHQINDKKSQNRSTAYMGGVQFQRWGDKVFGGDLYNLFLLNYSNGDIYGGSMRSAFNSSDKDSLASKWLLQWSGDFKTPNYATYYTFKYQNHLGADGNQDWSYLDIHLRPIYILNKNFLTGIDCQRRIVINDSLVAGATNIASWAADQDGSRIALMVAYALEDKQYELPTISMFVGTIQKDRATQFYSGQSASKSENFIRVNYEIVF